MDMMEGGEVKKFIQIWITVAVSLSYCYFIKKIVSQGITRLLAILPIVCLFLYLPLNLTTIHLGGITAFFIGWLATFKVLLLCFGKGPLSTDPSISLFHFLAVGCLPIKIQQHPSLKIDSKSKLFNDPSQNGEFKQYPSCQIAKNGSKSGLAYTVKFLLLGMMIRVYDYSEHIHPTVIMILYCFHMYFCLDLILAMISAMVRSILGLELEPQFNEPYLSTSLQDFWGRRWNIMVTSILRPSVYDPVLHLSAKIIGRKWAPLPAVMSTFIVSGVMHELIFYYIGHMKPTLEWSCFFLLHGVCLMAEIALKKMINGRFRLYPIVSGFMTVGFVTGTGLWLFVPQLLRIKADERAFAEYAEVGAFVRVLVESARLKFSI